MNGLTIINGQPPVTVVIEREVLELSVSGAPGPPGPAGASGGSYVHSQGSAATVWTINHNLGYHPNVTAFAGATEIEGDIDHINANTLTITYSYAISGVAYLS